MTNTNKETMEVRADWHRESRVGVPEIVYSAGKSDQQLLEICQQSIDNLDADKPLIFSRLTAERAQLLLNQFSGGFYYEKAQLFRLGDVRKSVSFGLPVAVVTGGTSDQAVAEEASVLLEVLGHEVTRIFDVGVAGLHRILSEKATLKTVGACIVIAGMEGALPSVVAGLTKAPIIAVPTSVGYGAHMQGITPLLAMLNSCAPGMTVVNIDNGVGAALAVHKTYAHLLSEIKDDGR